MVTMEDPESNSSEQVPKNRAQAWFRIILWILPSGFAMMSLSGFHQLYRTIPIPFWCIWILIPVNLIFILAAGWFDALLDRRFKKSVEQMRAWMLTFLLFQLLAIPIFSFLLIWTVSFIIDLFR
jgi:hypothetical protein